MSGRMQYRLQIQKAVEPAISIANRDGRSAFHWRTAPASRSHPRLLAQIFRQTSARILPAPVARLRLANCRAKVNRCVCSTSRIVKFLGRPTDRKPFPAAKHIITSEASSIKRDRISEAGWLRPARHAKPAQVRAVGIAARDQVTHSHKLCLEFRRKPR